MTVSIVHNAVEEIFDLYEKHGSEEYAGEKITQLEHMCQAAQLAEQGGFDEEVVLAAFLHDIGHICVSFYGFTSMDGYGIINHEKIGAAFLKSRGFSDRLIQLVERHVDAKRYLTFKYVDYYEQLSEASKITLKHQGGMMTENEALQFEADPLHELIIEMRRIDELAKLEHQPLPDLAKYKMLMEKHLLNKPSAS
jgi:2-amino-1-hydroxyethylphosphonate dioxygenase (glycine-forming)